MGRRKVVKMLASALFGAAIALLIAVACTVPRVATGRYSATVLDGREDLGTVITTYPSSETSTRYYIDFEFFDGTGVYHSVRGYEVSRGEFMKFYRGRGEMCVMPRLRGYVIGGCE
jgi:hypothetical protein